MKAPVPKALNRPSGDTSAPGDVPAGINALAVHPSSKLGVSVGQGEKSMRLWDLVRGKKAGVLVFERKVLEAVGEARFRGGEGRSVVWGRGGEEFAVGFERGVVVFGLDCAVRGVIKVEGTKVCQIKYLPGSKDSVVADDDEQKDDVQEKAVLAISTEDGRVLFYDTDPTNAVDTKATNSTSSAAGKKGKSEPPPPQLRLLAQIGTPTRGSRIKDFEFFALPLTSSDSTPDSDAQYILAVGTSDGSIRLWLLKQSELQPQGPATNGAEEKDASESGTTQDAAAKTANAVSETKQIGTLLGAYETGRRITCLAGFVMEDFNSEGSVKAKKGKVEPGDGDDDEQDGSASGRSDADGVDGDGADDDDDEFGGFD